MEEKIREYVNSIFVTVPRNTQLLALRTNVTKSLINRYYKYVDEGKTPGEAYDIIASSTQEILDAIDGVINKVKNTAARVNMRDNGAGYAPFSRGAAFYGNEDRSGEKQEEPGKQPKPPKAEHKAPKKKKRFSGATLGIAVTAAVVLLVAFGTVTLIRYFSAFQSLNHFIDQNSSYTDMIEDDHSNIYDIDDEDFEYHSDGIYRIAASDIEEIKLTWTRGKVIISQYNGDEIVLSESAKNSIDRDEAIRYEVRNGEILITESKRDDLVYYVPEKTLNILLPYSLAEKLPDAQFSLGSAGLNINGASFGQLWISSDSGSLELSDIKCRDTLSIRAGSSNADIEGDIGDLSFFSTSGDLAFSSIRQLCTVNASSISGDIALEGNLHRVNVDNRSGRTDISSNICPYSVEITSNSGQIDLEIPEKSDFILEYETVSGKLSSKLTLVESRGKYIRGDGIASFKIKTDSADLKIKRFD